MLISVVSETLAANEKVQLVGFEHLKKERAERKGRNPQTREEIVIPASKALYSKQEKP